MKRIAEGRRRRLERQIPSTKKKLAKARQDVLVTAGDKELQDQQQKYLGRQQTLERRLLQEEDLLKQRRSEMAW